jgi:uncharacterized membrane protein YoaK (UPF0700 family)
MTRFGRRSLLLAGLLSCLAGFVDANGFLSAGNFFVSFMSGNSTRLGVAISADRLLYAAEAVGVIGLFVAGVVLGTLVGQRAVAQRRKAILIGVGVLLCAAAASSAFHVPHMATICSVLAMGALNATFERDGEVAIGVTYMTGTLVKLGQRIASALMGKERPLLWPYALLWVGLVLGATLGAMAHERFGLVSLSIPGAAALIVAVLGPDGAAKGPIDVPSDANDAMP